MRQTICGTLLQLRVFQSLSNIVAEYALVRGDMDVWCSGQTCQLMVRVFQAFESLSSTVPMRYDANGLTMGTFSRDSCCLAEFYIPRTMFDSYYCEQTLEPLEFAVDSHDLASACTSAPLVCRKRSLNWFHHTMDDGAEFVELSNDNQYIRFVHRQPVLYQEEEWRIPQDLPCEQAASISLRLDDLLRVVGAFLPASSQRLFLVLKHNESLEFKCDGTTIVVNADPRLGSGAAPLVDNSKNKRERSVSVFVPLLKRIGRLLKATGLPQVTCRVESEPFQLMFEQLLPSGARARFLAASMVGP